jgi:hypothetical protein
VITVAQSGNTNNSYTGDVLINVSAGVGPAAVNSLVVVAIDILPDASGVLPTVTPPQPTAGHPEWNLITSDSVGSPNTTMVQYLYWHMIGGAENVPPNFTFTLTGAVAPAGCGSAGTPGCFPATGVGINYSGTCTEEMPSPCPTNSGSPIVLPFTSGIEDANNNVAAGGTFEVPGNAFALAALGTSDLEFFLGQSGVPISGAVFPGTLQFENGNTGTNPSLAFYDQPEMNGGPVGPFAATLPNFNIGDNIAQVIGIIAR